MNKAEVDKEMKTRIVTDKVVGNTLEQRVVDEDGKTVEFYQLAEGRDPILNIDPETPLKYAKLLKSHKVALKKVETRDASIVKLKKDLAEASS